MDLIDGKPTGSVRISFGYMSTLHDVRAFLKFVHECFVDNPTMRDADPDVFYDAVEEPVTDVDANAVEAYAECGHGLFAEKCTSTDRIENRASLIGEEALTHQITAQYTEDVSIPSDDMTLNQIFLYPIKSCGAFHVSPIYIILICEVKVFNIYLIDSKISLSPFLPGVCVCVCMCACVL